MPRAVANGIELEYEVIGADDAPPVVLIAGWGAQLIVWDDTFCQALVDRGFRAIRFDNRDVGLSTKLVDGPDYGLEDMADDVVGLLDHLDIERAHVMGASMGGMVAQVLAYRHPDRLLTVTSIMSTTGARGVGQASEAAAARLGLPAGETREERVAASIEGCRVNWGDSPQFPFDEELARWRAEVSEDRCHHPEGRMRQWAAMRKTGDRTAALATVDVPFLVIHGDNDGLVDVSGGRATADVVPGAELLVIEGMGHVVDLRANDRIADAFTSFVSSAGHEPR